ncbi:MAG: glycerol-3-phosphate responsive antiterminator [Candidatus Izemoplasmataceae bacterium]
MIFQGQRRLPAISDFKSLKKFLKSDLVYGIIVDFQLAEIGDIIEEFRNNHKKVLVHIDMIHGLTPDEFGAIHLIQNHHVDGIISIKPKVIMTAKKRKVIAMQRIFLRDSLSFNKSLDFVSRSKPDCVEVLPAISGELLRTIKRSVQIPLFCGGLISSEEQIQDCFDSGADGITVSNSTLWSNEKGL